MFVFIKNKDTTYSVNRNKNPKYEIQYNVRIDNNDQKKIQRILNYRIKKRYHKLLIYI